MDSTVRDLVRIRSVVIWCAITAAAAGLVSVALPMLTGGWRTVGSEPAFTELLVLGCAATSIVATGWLWAITTDVVVRVLTSGGRVVVRRPGAVRLLLLVACGAVALGAAVAPAAADERRPAVPHSLAGLQLPDRASGDGRLPHAEATTEPRRAIRVRPGDSLWAISEARLGPGATVADLVDHWHRIYDRNADVIGPDPDLILPGQLLELPPTG